MPRLMSFLQELVPDWMRRKGGTRAARVATDEGRTASDQRTTSPNASAGGGAQPGDGDGKSANGR